MISLLVVLAVAFISSVAYFLIVLLRKRHETNGLPCPPMQNRLLGHLAIAGECTRLFPHRTHVHHWIPYIQRKYNMGDIFYLDWWPLGPRWLFISDPEIASQYITTGQSLVKSRLTADYLISLLGSRTMVAAEGSQWKQLRGMFNPGFSASHLMTLVPYIVDAATVFHQIVQEKANANELFPLEEYATRLTIDIIGKVVLDADFDSQKVLHPIVDLFRERVRLMPAQAGPFDFSRFNIVRQLRVYYNGLKLDRLIRIELDRKLTSRGTGEKIAQSFKDRKRSIVDLAMDSYLKEESDRDQTGHNIRYDQDPAFYRNTIDSIKTFLFAGHDTTASTIAYVFYLLHFHPDVHKRLVVELDNVLSPNASTTTIADAIKASPHSINQLEYMTAVIRETLRLFVPASTLRVVSKGSNTAETLFITHPVTGQKLPMKGWEIWPASHCIHRNPKYFPQPAHFIPERFIPSETPFPNSKLFTMAGKDAWRPFEKGPRNCIGQELAMIEIKIVLAILIKEFDFTCEFDGVKCNTWTPIETSDEYADGRPGSERMTVEGHSCYQVLKAAANPRDGMPGRMSFRKSPQLATSQ